MTHVDNTSVEMIPTKRGGDDMLLHGSNMLRRETSVQRLRFDRPLSTDKSYPERAHIPDYYKRWERNFPEYRPPWYESPRLAEQDRTRVAGGWADPAQVSREQFLQWSRDGYLKSHEGPIQHDPETGRPLNPLGRTGISGRGVLGLWGPNQAADAIVTRISKTTGRLEMLFVLRPSSEWAIPGGFLDRGETELQAALRELYEETSIRLEDSITPWLIHQGIGDGPRITDHAWVETTAYHLHCADPEKAAKLIPQHSDEVLDAAWKEVTPELVASLYANHSDLVLSALTQFSLRSEGLSDTVQHQIASLDRNPLLASFGELRGKIGIYGGTFDPPHIAHIKMGPHVLQTCNLDAVVYVPTAQNPLKSSGPMATARERLDMLQYAVREHPGVFVSPIETRLQGSAYTIDTVDAINEQIDPTRCSLHLIIGSDSLRTLPDWKECQRLVREVDIIPVLRAGDTNPLEEKVTRERLAQTFGSEFVVRVSRALVTDFQMPVRATDVRSLLARGFGVGELLDPGVSDYIKRHAPYQILQ